MSRSKVQYFWINHNAEYWSFSGMAEGQVEDFSCTTESGRKRRVFSNFKKARVGDRFVCYEPLPDRSIVAIAELDREFDGENIYLRIVDKFSKPIPIDAVKSVPELSELDSLKVGRGTLLSLQKRDYDKILALAYPLPTEPSREVATIAKNSSSRLSRSHTPSVNKASDIVAEPVDLEVQSIKNLSRATVLAGHDSPELQLVRMLAAELMERFKESNRESFYEYVLEQCGKDRDSRKSTSYYIIRHFAEAKRAGESDAQVMAWLHQKYPLKESAVSAVPKTPIQHSERASANLPEPGEPRTRVHRQPAPISQVEPPQPKSEIASLSRKHRAMQYSNLIMRELVKEYSAQHDETSFAKFLVARCENLVSNNTGYTLCPSPELATLETESSATTSRINGERSISVKTSQISLKSISDDPEINDLLEIADILTMLRIPTWKNIKEKSDVTKTTTPREPGAEDFYDDMITKEFSSLLTKDRQFDVTYRLLILAAKKKSEGMSNEDVISLLKRQRVRYEEKKTCAARQNEVSSGIKPRQRKMKLDAFDYSMLETARLLLPVFQYYSSGRSPLEGAIIDLAYYYWNGAGNKNDYYIKMSVSLSGVSDIYTTILRIALMKKRGFSNENVVRYFEKVIDTHPEAISEFRSAMYFSFTPLQYCFAERIFENEYRSWSGSIHAIQSLKGQMKHKYDMRLRELGLGLDYGKYFDFAVIRQSLPKKFNNKGELCKKIKIYDVEKEFFQGFDFVNPHVSLYVLFPQSLFLIDDVLNIAGNAVKHRPTGRCVGGDNIGLSECQMGSRMVVSGEFVASLTDGPATFQAVSDGHLIRIFHGGKELPDSTFTELCVLFNNVFKFKRPGTGWGIARVRASGWVEILKSPDYDTVSVLSENGHKLLVERSGYKPLIVLV